MRESRKQLGKTRNSHSQGNAVANKSIRSRAQKPKDPVMHLEEVSPNSCLCSEVGDVSFESKGIEQEYDQICLKVSLHPLHFVIKNLLATHFKKNGGGTEQ